MEDTFMPISAPAMSTSKRTLTAAFEAGDFQAAMAACRQDVIFRTPILATVGDEIRGLPTIDKILQTAFTCLGMPQNVAEFHNPDGRYIITFDGAVYGHLIQIAWLVTEDAQGKVETIAAHMRPWPVVKLFREYMERRLRPDPVPDALWELPAGEREGEGWLKKLRDDRKLPV
jgi:hypothetical protein